MPENKDSDNSILDNQLAGYTDLVMKGRALEMSSTPEGSLMHDLQNVVLDIYQSVPEKEPTSEMTERIKSTLLNEWEKEFGRSTPEFRLVKWLTKIGLSRPSGWQSTTRRKQTLAISAAVAAIIIIAILAPFISSQGSLTATAIGDKGLIGVLLILLTAGSATLWWLYRRKK
jgi:hypothetical protein